LVGWLRGRERARSGGEEENEEEEVEVQEVENKPGLDDASIERPLFSFPQFHDENELAFALSFHASRKSNAKQAL